MDPPFGPMHPWMPRGTSHRLITCAVASLAVLLFAPVVAHANVQVSVQAWDMPSGPDPSGALTVVGTNGVDDQATITNVPNGVGPGDDQLVITSSTGPLTDSDGDGAGACDLVGSQVVCDLALVPGQIVILSGGTGDDDLRVEGTAFANAVIHVFGDLGNDTLRGGPGAERFYGENGLADGACRDPDFNEFGVDECDDTIHDGLGNDRVDGEGGNDLVVQAPLAGSSPNSDEDDIRLAGGSQDGITYAARAAADAVTIRIGGTDGIDANAAEAIDASGTPGEEDDIDAGIERVTGTPGNDTFRTTTSFVPISMDGIGGDDTFIASPSNEVMIGGSGTDTATWADLDFAQSGIVATANGVADDGDPDFVEADDVRGDIEHIIGTPGIDTLLGAPTSGCRVAGGSGADTISAPATGCTLEGGNGADVLTGSAGADTMRPGASGIASSDVLTFGGGPDTVDYANGSLVGTDSTIVGVQASANAGVTIWCYSLGTGTTSARKTVGGQAHLDAWADAPETIVGTVVTDTLCGGPAGTRLEGGAGADVLVGNGGVDVILGGLGNDLLNGQGGSDTLDGGDGDDNLNGGAGTDVVDGGPGDDPHVRGGGGSDTIRGGTGNDTLDELSFSAIEQGVTGDELDAGDVLDGGAGTDTIDGASGDDVLTCTVDNLADAWSDSGGGTEAFDCSGLGIAITYAAGPGIDTLVGSALNDTLSGATTIDGGAGNDTLVAAAAGSTIRGGPGNDALTGGDAVDVLGGGDGADSIDARGGNDVLDGGFGGDAISGGSGAEVLSYEARSSAVAVSLDGVANDGTAGEGDNVQPDIEELVGSAHADTLTAGTAGTNLVGGDGNDVLVGSAVGELLQGGAGNDRLASGAGANVLEGGAGDDTLLGGANVDRLDGGDGHDVLDGGAGTDVFIGGAGRDGVTYGSRTKPVSVSLGDTKANDGEAAEKEDVPFDVENAIGGAGRDRLVGNGTSNVLRGGGGNDTMLAGAGNDLVYGGAGNDTLTGGKGNDKLYGEAGGDTLDAKDTVAKDKQAREVVDGGAGRDVATVDPKDRIVRVETRRSVLPVVTRTSRRA